jgi:hypothetical protein
LAIPIEIIRPSSKIRVGRAPTIKEPMRFDATFADASTNAMALIFSSAVAQNMMAADQGYRSRHNQNWTVPISDDQYGDIT